MQNAKKKSEGQSRRSPSSGRQTLQTGRFKKFIDSRNRGSKKNLSRFESDRSGVLKLPELPQNGVKFALSILNNQRVYSDSKEIREILLGILPVMTRHKEIRRQLNTPMWTKKTAPWEVLNWFFTEYEKMLPTSDIDWYLSKQDTGYAIVNIHRYEHLSEHGYFMPCEFLPELEKEDPALFNLVFQSISALYQMDIQLWDYESEFGVEHFYDEIECHQDNEEKVSGLKEIIREYEEIAKLFSERITTSGVTVESLEKIIEGFQANGELSSEWLKWTESVLRLFREGKTMGDFVGEDIRNSEGMTPYSYVKFVWSMEDEVSTMYFNYVDESVGEYGVIPFQSVTTLTRTNNLTAGDIEKPSMWPFSLCDLITKGAELVEEIY